MTTEGYWTRVEKEKEGWLAMHFKKFIRTKKKLAQIFSSSLIFVF